MNRTWLTGSIPNSAICSGDLECRRSGAVVVDPGALGHRVEVGTRDDYPIGAACGRLGDHVLGLAHLGHSAGGHRQGHLAAGHGSCSMYSTSAAPASAIISMTGTSCGKVPGRSRAGTLVTVALVEDDHRSAPASTALAILS